MDELQRYDYVVGLIYEAALLPERWVDCLRAVADMLQADVFHLVGWNTQAQRDVIGIIDSCDGRNWASALGDYQQYYGLIDPRRDWSAHLGEGKILACHEVFDAAFVAKNEFYQDYLLRQGLHYSLGGCILRSPQLDIQLGLVRAPERGPYSEVSQQYLQRLMPHFKRALQIQLQQQQSMLQTQVTHSGLNYASLTVLASNQQGELVYCNQHAERLLQSCQNLKLVNQRIRLTDVALHKQFEDLLAQTLHNHRPHHLLLTLTFPAQQKVRYSLTIIKLQDQHTQLAIVPQAVLLYILAPLEKQRMATGQQLMLLFDFTPAEARLARALIHGDSLEDYALSAQLSLSTVRTQLRAIFAKTGITRQVDLVRILSQIPAVRE